MSASYDPATLEPFWQRYWDAHQTFRAERHHFVRAIATTVVVAACSLGCGYRALHAAPAEARLHVVLVKGRVADATANDDVVSGVRTSLAREGALLPGNGYPRVEVEVLRADEASEGIAVGQFDGTRAPRARATQVGIVARAWIVRSADGPHESDTGDLRIFDLVESPEPNGARGLVDESMRYDNALRAAARRVGEKLGARVLGHPVARDESPSELW